MTIINELLLSCDQVSLLSGLRADGVSSSCLEGGHSSHYFRLSAVVQLSIAPKSNLSQHPRLIGKVLPLQIFDHLKISWKTKISKN